MTADRLIVGPRPTNSVVLVARGWRRCIAQWPGVDLDHEGEGVAMANTRFLEGEATHEDHIAVQQCLAPRLQPVVQLIQLVLDIPDLRHGAHVQSTHSPSDREL